MDTAGCTLPLAPIFDITRDIRGMHPQPRGVGGQSDVYAAFWASPDEYMPVAIKVLRFAGDLEKIRKRLDSEISLWARVSHPHVQRLLGICFLSTSALPAMVSEWHPNGDITAYLKTKLHDRKLQEIKYRLLVEVLEGVGYLHEHHIVHGDIKGANVLIAKDGSARLSDFGFSKILTEHSRSLSQWSTAKGTIRWMAPEFFDEDDRVAIHTRASDVWAIGCLIIEVQTGDLPYATMRFEPKVILAISKGELPAPQPFEPDALWRLMRICCQVEPSARYTASRLLSRLRIEHLTSYLQAHPLSAPRWCKPALVDVRDHLRACEMSHSPMEPSVRKVLGILGVLELSWNDELKGTFESVQQAACKLLGACVEIAQQQPPTDTAIQFMTSTVPPLLHMLRQAEEYLSYRHRYPAEILRPLAKVLAEHGDASVAAILMRFCAYTPGVIRLARDALEGSSGYWETAWSGDGSLLATADGASVAVSQLGKAPFSILPVEKSSIHCIAMSPDGQRLACSSMSGLSARVTVSLWDIPSQSALDIGTMPADIGPTRDLVFSRDGLCFASTNDDDVDDLWDTVYVWRVGKNPTMLGMHLPWKGAVAFTADSQIVLAKVSASFPSATISWSLYDLDTTALLSSRNYSSPYTSYCALGSQGRYLMLSAPFSDTLRLSNTLSGRLLCSLKMNKATGITCAASSLDGAYAAAGTFDGFVYVWDVETSTLLENSPLPVHRHSISRLKFTSDGTKIITMTAKGEVCVSDIRGSWLRWDL